MESELTEKQDMMIERVVQYAKENGLDEESAVALGLLADTDEMAQWLTEYLNKNPNVDFYDLLALIVKVKDLKPMEFEIVDDDDFDEEEE